MPNIWSRTNRKIYEAFKGPRTVDSDFNKKVSAIKDEEKYLDHLQLIINRFHESRDTHKQHLLEINHFLLNCYDTNSYYWPYMNDIINTHKELEKLHDDYLENIMRITNLSKNLSAKLNQIKENVAERDRLRFIHDHYDEKMEKYVKERNKRLEASKGANLEFEKGFERNDKKYHEAAKNYIDQSVRTYSMMDDYINTKPNYINPIIVQMIEQEIRFYTDSGNLMVKLNGIPDRFQVADVSRPKIISTEYDPCKFLRARNVILNRSVVSEQIMPLEGSIIRVVEEVPVNKPQEIIVNNIVPQSTLVNRNAEIMHEVSDVQPLNPDIHINIKENKIDNFTSKENGNTGVLNIHDLYVQSQENKRIIQDNTAQKNEEILISEENVSEYSEVKGEIGVDEQLQKYSITRPQPRYEEQNISYFPSLLQPIYASNTILENAEEIPFAVKQPKTMGEEISPVKQYVTPVDEYATISNGFFNTQEYLPTSLTSNDSYRFKAVESEDKIKLVYNVAPLIKTLIQANDFKKLNEDKEDTQNLSKKMTAVSEEFLYTDPISNETLKIRVSLKNKIAENHPM